MGGGGACREVWLVRHGETASNVGRIIQGQTDTPLNARGEEQARRLGRWLLARHAHEPFSAVVASPLSRAWATAELAAGALGLPMHEEPGLMERGFGELEGRSAEEAYAVQDQADDPFAHRPAGGESTWDMAARVHAAFDAWTARDDVGERLLIVTHGGPIGALVSRTLELPFCRDHLRRFRRDNTGITILRRKDDKKPWVVDVLNARPHL